MAFNGSGLFLRIHNWIADAAASIKITASRMDAEMDGFATGLSNCVTKDGQTTPTANIPMGTFRHTGVGDSSSLTSYPSTKQVQNGSVNYSSDTGVANAYIANLSPAPTAYVAGMHVFVNILNTNTAVSTINVNSLGVKSITTWNGVALISNELIAGQVAHLIYNGTNFNLISNDSILPKNNVWTGTQTLSSKSLWQAEGAAIASAATTNIWAGDGNTVHVTGSTGPITSFGAAPQAGAVMWVIFDGTPSVTHNGTNINMLNGGTSITAAVGDFFRVYADTTTQFDIIHFKASGLFSPNIQTFPGSGTWIKPDMPATSKAVIDLWSGAGSGARAETGNPAGGGGGCHRRLETTLAALGATESVVIGPGGASKTTAGDGNPGTNSTFGSLLTAYAGGSGGGGATGAGGGGAGELGTGTSAASSTAGLGGPGFGGTSGSGPTNNTGGNGGLNASSGENAHSPDSGGGGGGGGSPGGTADYGGAGGAGAGGGARAAAKSINGGDGGSVSAGNVGTAGVQPAGGGAGSVAANSGAGGAGKCIVTVYPG